MKYKITKQLLKKLKPYWKKVLAIEAEYCGRLGQLEYRMEKKTGIKGIEFYKCDGEIVGIGNLARTMPLIQSEELDK